jgi:hypothetical protein
MFNQKLAVMLDFDYLLIWSLEVKPEIFKHYTKNNDALICQKCHWKWNLKLLDLNFNTVLNINF